MFKLFNWRHFVAFNVDDVAAATPPIAPVEPAITAAPWAADAAAYFGDNPDAIEAFDRYQREKAQPYVTKLQEETKDARELWTDLNTDPDTTARDLIASIYRDQPDVVAAYDAIFNAEAAVEPVAPAEPTTPAEAAALSDEDRELIEWARSKRDAEVVDTQAADYAKFKDGLKSSHGLNDADVAAIDVFVYQHPEDPDAAVSAYKAWRVAQGLTETVEDEPAATPPVLGTDGSTAATPPLATTYNKWDQRGDAIKNFLAREAASATPPPVVG
jgi:hypothetical protein